MNPTFLNPQSMVYASSLGPRAARTLCAKRGLAAPHSIDPISRSLFSIPQSAIRNPQSMGAFTILELLVVIGIVILLFGIAAPAYNAINKGSNMRAAERQIQAGAFLARQHAIANHEKAVFFVPTAILTDNKNVRSNMLNHAYIIYGEELTDVASPEYIFGKVETLPQGIVFTNSFSGWKDVTFSTNGVDLFSGKGIRYAPTGAIYWKDAPSPTTFDMILTEGSVSEAGAITYRSGGTVSTSQVRSVTGRCLPK